MVAEADNNDDDDGLTREVEEWDADNAVDSIDDHSAAKYRIKS